jgi:AraC-like DNA-binding protein
MMEFVDFWIFFGVGLCFLLALVNFLSKTPESKERGDLSLLAFFFGAAGLRIALYTSGKLEKEPNWIYFFFFSVLIIGPIVLQIGIRITDFAVRQKLNLKMHLTPAFLALGFDLYFNSLDNTSKLAIIQDALYNKKFCLAKIPFLFIIAHISGYFIYLFYMFWKIGKDYKLNYSKLVWGILSLPSLAVIILGSGFTMVDFDLAKFGASLLTLTVIMIFILQTKYPLFFVTLQTEIQKKKYETILLGDVNIEQVRTQILDLMNKEKIYREEDLRLSSFAYRLDITAHQLSRILNEKFGKNFNEFINYYRIEEAKKKLLSEPQKPVLNIGLEVGFNSKTSFHNHFTKNTNMTPKEYRNQSLLEKKAPKKN